MGTDTIRSGTGLENVSVEAIADSNPKGLEEAAKRSGAKRKYADYREMLQKEKPNLVSIAPRHPDCHKEMALAAIEVGAHIILEKPFTEHLDEADEIHPGRKGEGIQIVVGHKNRYSNEYWKMKRALEEGFLGQVLEMRVQGKQDQRAGGEDMIVLGTHDFDTMRFFFGDPSFVHGIGDGAGPADHQSGRPQRTRTDAGRGRYDPRDVSISETTSTLRGNPPKARRRLEPAAARRGALGFHIFGTKRILSYYSGSQPCFGIRRSLGTRSLPLNGSRCRNPFRSATPAASRQSGAGPDPRDRDRGKTALRRQGRPVDR